MGSRFGSNNNFFSRIRKWTAPLFPNLYISGGFGAGALGDGTSINKSSPVLVTSSQWAQVATSFSTTGAIRSDGTLWTWGGNTTGQLGDGTTVSKSNPVQVAGSWTMVSSYADTFYAIKTDKTLWAWGLNNVGQIGDGSLVNKSNPVQISGSWNKVSAGQSFVYALTSANVWNTWGLNSTGQLATGTTTNRSAPGTTTGTPASITDISAGSAVGGVLTSTGAIWTVGTGTRLGDSSTVNKSTPVQIGSDKVWSKFSIGTGALACTSDGLLWNWGPYEGAGGTITRSSPTQTAMDGGYPSAIAGAPLTGGFIAYGLQKMVALGQYAEVSAASSNQLGIKSDGSLWGWGVNTYGTLGLNDTRARSSPVQIKAGTSFIQVAVGTDGSSQPTVHAIDNTGKLWGWGSGISVGDGTTVARSSPVQIISGTSFSLVAGGGMAIDTSGNLWSWGVNSSGRGGWPLVGGVAINRSVPIQLTNIAGTYTYVARHQHGSVAILSDSRYAYAGITSLSGFGGVVTSYPTLTASSTTGWKEIAFGTASASSYNAVAVKTDGTLWTWGSNTYGQLGDNSVAARLSVGQIGSDTDWTHVGTFSPQGSGVLAQKTNGQLYAWGFNYYWSIQQNTYNSSRSSPVLIQTGTDTTFGIQGAEGGLQSAAIKISGTVYQWGASANYVNGRPTSWLQISCGQTSKMALREDNVIMVWGGQATGQFGSGDILEVTYPQAFGQTNYNQMDAGIKFSTTLVGSLNVGGGTLLGPRT